MFRLDHDIPGGDGFESVNAVNAVGWLPAQSDVSSRFAPYPIPLFFHHVVKYRQPSISLFPISSAVLCLSSWRSDFRLSSAEFFSTAPEGLGYCIRLITDNANPRLYSAEIQAFFNALFSRYKRVLEAALPLFHLRCIQRLLLSVSCHQLSTATYIVFAAFDTISRLYSAVRNITILRVTWNLPGWESLAAALPLSLRLS